MHYQPKGVLTIGYYPLIMALIRVSESYYSKCTYYPVIRTLIRLVGVVTHLLFLPLLLGTYHACY